MDQVSRDKEKKSLEVSNVIFGCVGDSSRSQKGKVYNISMSIYIISIKFDISLKNENNCYSELMI